MFNREQFNIKKIFNAIFSKRKIALLKVGLSVLLIFLLIKYSGLNFQCFAGLDWRFVVLAGVVLVLQYNLVALRWWWILRGFEIKISFFTALSLTWQGLFYMLFLPGGTLTADVCKAALTAGKTAKQQQLDAAFTVIVDRVCGLTALVYLTLAVIAVVILTGGCGDLLMSGFFNWLLKSFVVVGLLLTTATTVFFCGGRLLKKVLPQKIFNLLDFRSNGLLSRLAEGLLCSRKMSIKYLAPAIYFSMFVTFPLLILSVYLISCGVIGNNRAAFYGAMISSSIGELSGILPLTPGSIGVRDTIASQCFQACGICKDLAILIPVVYTALMVITGSIGGLFALYMIFSGKKKN